MGLKVKATWRDIALEYACEQCMAEPGEPCMTMRGKVKYDVHTSRSEQASKDNWEGPSTPQGRHLRITPNGEIGDGNDTEAAEAQDAHGAGEPAPKP